MFLLWSPKCQVHRITQRITINSKSFDLYGWVSVLGGWGSIWKCVSDCCSNTMSLFLSLSLRLSWALCLSEGSVPPTQPMTSAVTISMATMPSRGSGMMTCNIHPFPTSTCRTQSAKIPSWAERIVWFCKIVALPGSLLPALRSVLSYQLHKDCHLSYVFRVQNDWLPTALLFYNPIPLYST